MPKQGWEGLAELLGDLFRELSLIVRIGLFAGLGIGFFLGLYLLLQVPADSTETMIYVSFYERRIVFLFVFGLTFLGAVVGTTIGVVLELFFGEHGGPDKKKGKR